MTNILLFIFDFITLPITMIRLLLIYFFGSKYNINSFGFLDVMMHADKKYFNQEDLYPTLDTLKDDIRVRINCDSRYNNDILIISGNTKCTSCDELKKLLYNKESHIMEVKGDNKYDNVDIVNNIKENGTNDLAKQIISTSANKCSNDPEKGSVFKKKSDSIKSEVESDDFTMYGEMTEPSEYNNYNNHNNNNNLANTDEFINSKNKLLNLIDKIKS